MSNIGRRTFQYVAALIGLLVTLASLLVLSGEALRLLSSGLSPAGTFATLVRESTLWLGLGLAGFILWVVTWFPANDAARRLTLAGAAERASTIRKAYLYTGQLVALAVAVAQADRFVAEVLNKAMDDTAFPASLPGSALASAAGTLIALAFWGHLRWVTLHDGDFGREDGRAANWRRAYVYLAAAGGFTLLIAGALGYLRAMLGLAAGALLSSFSTGPAPIAAAAWRGPVVSSVAELVVGIPLAIFIWSTASRLAGLTPVQEHSALSRTTLLHAGLLFGAAASLASMAYLLQQTLVLLTGAAAGAGLAWSSLITALVYLPVGIICWIAFAGAARHSAVLGRTSPGAVAIRRLTFYLLAAAGLAAFTLGMVLLWQTILTGMAGASMLDRFSLGAALTLVGAPAWWGYWWPRQLTARQAGPQGADERRSAVRQAYLYGVIIVAAAALALSLLALVLRVMSAPATLAVTGVSLFWFVAHLLVLRGDRRLHAAELATPEEPADAEAIAPTGAAADGSGSRSFSREQLAAVAAAGVLTGAVPTERPVVVIDGGDGAQGAALLAALRNALPQAILWPIGLNPTAQAALNVALSDAAALDGAAEPSVPPDALARAAAVVASTDLLRPGGADGEAGPRLLSELAASQAQLILLPPHHSRLRWVAAPDWPVERWIENAVIEVGNVVQ